MITNKVQYVFDTHAELCKVIANPKRLMIIDLLSQGEMSVGDLAKTIGTSSSTVSQHLRLLRDRQVVGVRPDGKTSYYYLVTPKMVKACKMIRALLIERMQRAGELPKSMNAETLLRRKDII